MSESPVTPSAATAVSRTDRIGTDRNRIGWPDLGIAVAGTVVLYVIGILLYLQIPRDDTVAAGLTLFAVSGLAPLGGVLIANALRHRDLGVFGVRKVAPRWLGIGVLIGLGVVALNVAVTSVVSATTDAADVQGNYQSAATSGVIGFVGALVLGAVLTPIGEEFLFRGVIFGLLSRYRTVIAVSVSTIVFGLSHGVNLALPAALIVGVSAALLMHRTGSVWPGIIVHAVNNASSSVIAVVYLQIAT